MSDAPAPSVEPLYSRVMLKISGEALMGRPGVRPPPAHGRAWIAREVKSWHDLGVEIAW